MDVQVNLGSELSWEPGVSHIHKVLPFVTDEEKERHTKKTGSNLAVLKVVKTIDHIVNA
jgi:hypothetical protein